jgi:methyl-accepting chemotaxis protein
VALNQKVKNLIQKLGEAIHETVSESEDIAGVVKNIREQGFDVLLMLEATIGLNEVDSSAEEVEDVAEETDGPFTSSDMSFLKSLRISLSETEGASPEA